MTQPFDGIRIIDATSGIAGAMATMHFADFGADVVRIEPPGADRSADEPGYLMWNRNKRRVTADVATFAGLSALRELLAGADAAVFDERPGELERLGLDSVTVLTANAALLHVWMPPYGTEGRWSQLPADDLLLHAVAGVAHLQWSYEDQPVALVTPQGVYGHATIAANAIAAGLWERARSGQGQALVVSGLHGVSSVEMGGAITAGGSIRMARTSRGGAHYGLYRAGDGEWFFLGCLTAGFFLRALEAVGLMEIMAWEGVDGQLTNIMANPELTERVRSALEAKFAEATREHWLTILREANVPRGPVGRREEWFREETVAANGMRLELDHPKLGLVEMPGVSLKLADTPGTVRGFLRDAELADVRAEWPSRPGIEPRPGVSAAAPLAGVRVIDIGAYIAGTFAPTVLANFGADVIKIEPIDGDGFRPYGLNFTGHNLGKRSLSIDLKSPEGRKVLERLVSGADVVLDNFRMGVRERLGIDYATLSAINPRIITCSVTAYGPVGPLSADPGFDPLLQARSGMMRAQGGEEEPVYHQIAVNDTATAMMAAFGIQAALHARERTGHGQEVTTCLANQSVLFQSGELTWFEGRPEAPTGGRDCIGFTALRRFYRCADGWLAISCRRAGEFHALAVALSHPEWAGRTTAEKALLEPINGVLGQALVEALAAMPRAEALDRLLAKGVPAAPVTRADELFADPWLRRNGFFQTIDDPQWGAVTAPRTYATWSRSASGFPRRAPLNGEHSREILRECGYDEVAISELVAAGVVLAGG